MAEFLNNVFYEFDYTLLSFYHRLAESAGGFLTPLAQIISFLGEKGILYLILAVTLMLFSKTRKVGVCLFGSVCCGALITNIVLKETVARLRPYDAYSIFHEWWEYLGGELEAEFSFPSGHATAITATMVSLCLTKGKKMLIPSAVAIAVMGASRNYLMVHYPSDIIGGFLSGATAAVIAYIITVLIFRFLEKNKDKKFFAWCLNFNIIKGEDRT